MKMGAAAGGVAICTTTDRPLGVLQNAPNINEIAVVRVEGESLIQSDAAYTYADLLMVADANGQVDTATAATFGTTIQYAVGEALEAATGGAQNKKALIRVQRYGIGAS
jgi:hypothetical protein